MNHKQASRIAAPLAGIWVLGIIIGVIGFFLSWDQMPGVIDVVMATTLLAPIALPKSFGDLMGITSMHSTKNTLLIAAVYWPVTLTLHWLAFKTASKFVLLVVGTIVLLSAFNWINVGASMVGI